MAGADPAATPHGKPLHAGFTEMTIEDLRAAMDADRDVLLLDVRADIMPPLSVLAECTICTSSSRPVCRLL